MAVPVLPSFQFHPNAFPILTPQQMSPLGGLLSDVIGKRLALAKARTAEAELPYAGLSKGAQAASQLAYANAVTPQYTLKAAANPAIWSNMSEAGRKGAANIAGNAATGNVAGGVTSPLLQQIYETYARQQQEQNQPSFFSRLYNAITGNESVPQQQLSQNNVGQVAPQNVAPVANSEPQMQSTQEANQTPDTFTREQNYKRITSKGPAQGAKEGEQQAGYGAAIAGGINQEQAAQQVSTILQNPIFRQIADTPFFNKAFKNFKSQAGKENEKKAIGELDAATENLVTGSVNMLSKNGASDERLRFVQNMKPSDNDSLDTKLGKIVSIITYDRVFLQQKELADQYMATGMRQSEAEIKAAKEVDSNKIRQEVRSEVYPKKNSNKYYAQTPEEFNSGKAAERKKVINGITYVQTGKTWHPETE